MYSRSLLKLVLLKFVFKHFFKTNLLSYLSGLQKKPKYNRWPKRFLR